MLLLLLFTVCTYYVHINICKSITVNVINSQKTNFGHNKGCQVLLCVVQWPSSLISCRSRIHMLLQNRGLGKHSNLSSELHSAVDHFEMSVYKWNEIVFVINHSIGFFLTFWLNFDMHPPKASVIWDSVLLFSSLILNLSFFPWFRKSKRKPNSIVLLWYFILQIKTNQL